MEVHQRRRAIIIGGGPGGLTVAIALRRAGFEPAIYERASQIREIGSGLTLWPNALRALAVLGLAESVLSVSMPTGALVMSSRYGEKLFDLAAVEQERRFGMCGVTTCRADLLETLLNKLGDNVIHIGTRCTGFRQDNMGVTALFENGSQVRGDVLIGADGIKSIIRRQVCGEKKLRYAGYTVWRGVTEFKLAESVGLTSMGRGAQFGFFPLTRHRVYWFASVNAQEGRASWSNGHKREILARFGGWHEPIEALIEATEDDCILCTDIYDRGPLKHWSNERVTLLGDAAHPATPGLGQGGCQAIEDAVVLAECLSKSQEIAPALKAYEARRLRRTKAVVLQSRFIGQMGQWENPAVCYLRDRLIKNLPEQIRLWQLRWLFSFKP
jgi:FAD-dependent urate hydroxylase